MAERTVLDRIAAWQAAGLIDAPTAERLAAAEAAEAASGDVTRGPGARSTAAAFFGPTPSIGEVFGYLGGAFVLAAWHAFAFTWFPYDAGPVARAFQFAVPAAALIALGWLARRGGGRGGRAAGVAFAVAIPQAYAAAALALGLGSGADDRFLNTVAAGVAVAVALAVRRLHPAVLTQLALIGALLSLATNGLSWLDGALGLDPCRYGCSYGDPGLDGPGPVVRVVLTLAWWLAWALGLGWLGYREGRGGGADPAADRRALVTRVVAGLVAVTGATIAVMESGPVGPQGLWDRVLSPVLGDAVILVVALALVWLALRRTTTAYIYPGALGVIIALTDANVRYLGDRAGFGTALLVEGLILLGAGLAADRLRRRVAGGDAGREAATTAPDTL